MRFGDFFGIFAPNLAYLADIRLYSPIRGTARPKIEEGV